MSEDKSRELFDKIDKITSLYGALLHEKKQVIKIVEKSTEQYENIAKESQDLMEKVDLISQQIDASIKLRIDQMSDRLKALERDIGNKLTDTSMARLRESMERVSRASDEAVRTLRSVKQVRLKNWFVTGVVLIIFNVIVSFGIVKLAIPHQSTQYYSAQDLS